MTNRDAIESVIREELLHHVGEWLDNGNTEKCHCWCGHRPQLGELHADHVAKAVARVAMEVATSGDTKKTKCLGFRWIGQSFACCDLCGDPFWEHDFDTRRKPGTGAFDDEPFEYVPISDEEKAACRARWGSSR